MSYVVDLLPKSFHINLTTMQPDYVVLKRYVTKHIRKSTKFGLMQMSEITRYIHASRPPYLSVLE